MDPFFGPIEEVVRQSKEEAEKEDDTEGAGQPNPHYCKSLIDIILHYAGAVPLWSGLLLVKTSSALQKHHLNIQTAQKSGRFSPATA